jgi:GPH family glycoside/pentoside/hexuronide:cation symporter
MQMNETEPTVATNQEQQTRYVPNKERWAFYWSAFLRDMSYGMAGQMTTFYVDVLGFATGKFKWILRWLPVVERIYDGVNDPLVGAYYDRRPYTTAKAKPFFKITAFPVAIGLICSFLPITFSGNETTNMLCRAAFALFAYMLYEGFQTANATAHMSLYNSISPNLSERTSIVAIARSFAIGGSGLVAGFVPIIYGMIDQTNVGEKKNLFFFTALGVGLFYLLYNKIIYSGVHERTIVPPEKKPQFGPQMANLFRNKPFVTMMIARALAGLLNSGSTTIYFYQYNIGNAGMMTYVSFIALPSYILASWLVPKLCKRFEKHTIYIACMFAEIAVSLLYLFVGYEHTWFVFLQSFLTSIPHSVQGALYWIMLSDAVDYGEWTTGERGDGMIYAVEGMTAKIVGALGQMSTQLIIEYIKFVPNAATQSAFTMLGLFRVPIYIGIASKFACALPYFFYKFTKDKHAIAIAEIQARKAAPAPHNS